jgi:hypothetical protein
MKTKPNLTAEQKKAFQIKTVNILNKLPANHKARNLLTKEPFKLINEGK